MLPHIIVTVPQMLQNGEFMANVQTSLFTCTFIDFACGLVKYWNVCFALHCHSTDVTNRRWGNEGDAAGCVLTFNQGGPVWF